jgi:hypothetical protein
VLEIELPRPRTLALAESPQFGAHEARLRQLLRAQASPAQDAASSARANTGQALDSLGDLS